MNGARRGLIVPGSYIFMSMLPDEYRYVEARLEGTGRKSLPAKRLSGTFLFLFNIFAAFSPSFLCSFFIFWRGVGLLPRPISTQLHLERMIAMHIRSCHVRGLCMLAFPSLFSIIRLKVCANGKTLYT